jgi:hypothetical protein
MPHGSFGLRRDCYEGGWGGGWGLAALSSPLAAMGASSALRSIPPAAARDGIDLRDTP